MKIALINGSPKTSASASETLLRDFKGCFTADNICDNSLMFSEYSFFKPDLDANIIEEISCCDALVFIFPLYVDAVPSHLLANLCALEEFYKEKKPKKSTVYSIVNSGFFEGAQCAIALQIMKNWCERAGLKWGQGLGIGGGGMLTSVKNVALGRGPKKSIGAAMKTLSENLIKARSVENVFVTVDIPRETYRIAAQLKWRTSIIKNRLKPSDLNLK